MKGLILAAGFGTRLIKSAQGTKFENIISEIPKPLLIVNGKPVIEQIVFKIQEYVDEIIVVSNNKFYSFFEEWVDSVNCSVPIRILNNGVSSLEERKGAIRDMKFSVEEAQITDDLLIIGGDNLFSFNIGEFTNFFELHGDDCIVIKELKNKEDAKLKYGVVEMDGNKVISFEEKPENPKTNLATTCIYLLKKESLGLFDNYLNEDSQHDSPGYFISWLAKRKLVFGWITDVENIIDIGSLSQIEDMLREQ